MSIRPLGKAIVGEPVEVACSIDDEVSTEHSLDDDDESKATVGRPYIQREQKRP